MKTAIVYYSLNGNTEQTANKIAEKIGADLIPVRPVKAYPDTGFAKLFWGGKSAVFKDKPDLEEYDIDLSSYERIVFGYPVWASTFTPPLRTFIEDNKDALAGKSLAVFACQGGSGAEKSFEKLAKCIGIDKFEITGIFIDPLAKKNDKTDSDIDEFASKISE